MISIFNRQGHFELLYELGMYILKEFRLKEGAHELDNRNRFSQRHVLTKTVTVDPCIA